MAKVINHKIEIYVIINSKGKVSGDRVFLNKNIAETALSWDRQTKSEDLYLDTITLPFVGQHLSYIHIYRGFDYDYGSGSMHDVCYTSDLYPSVELAKADDGWKSIMRIVDHHPEKVNVYPNKICSKDGIDNSDWYYGDVMEGKFVAEVRKLKVDRRN